MDPDAAATEPGVTEGGDPACWQHLLADTAPPSGALFVTDLATFDTSGSSGAIWHLPHGGDLDANVVVLHAGDSIGDHVNAEVDVMIVGLTGTMVIRVDGADHRLGPRGVSYIPKGVARSVRAADDVTYLSIHLRRAGVRLGPRPPADPR